MRRFIVRGLAAAATVVVAALSAQAPALAVEKPASGQSAVRPAAPAPLTLTREQIAQRGYQKFDPQLMRVAEAAATASPSAMRAALEQAAPGVRLALKAPSTVPAVLVEINVKGDPAAVQAQLRALGVEKSAQYRNRISAWVPADQLKAAAALGGVRSMRASMMRAHVGAVTSQGDFFQRSKALRLARPGLTGSGVTVGVLSDSFGCRSAAAGTAATGYSDDVASGDLPAGVEVLAEIADCTQGTDEGRAMAQIVYDVAPGTQLKFYTAFNGEADFANGIVALAQAGAKVIVDDVGYFDEPYYQDGIVAQAVDQATALGATYFSSAGNNARNSYEGTFGSSGQTGPAGSPVAGLPLMNFAPSGSPADTVLPISMAANDQALYILQWDQSYSSAGGAGAQNQIVYCFVQQPAAGVALSAADFVYCGPPNNIGDDPVFIDFETFPTDFAGGIVVALAGGTAPQYVKIENVALAGNDPVVQKYATNSGTATGHTAALGAGSTGASYFRANPICLPDIYPQFTLESFSSAGGTPILFDAAGNRLATPDLRQKPNFVAPDGGATTFFYSPLGARDSTVPDCVNKAEYYNFFGTSAAAPHAAGVAALLLQAFPAATSAQIRQALADSAIDMGVPGTDFDSGAGFIQADAALAQLSPKATLSATSIDLGTAVIRQKVNRNSVTLTNTGNSTLNVGTIGVTGVGYSATSNCGASLAPQASCTITVSFAPVNAGTFQGKLSVASNDVSSPATAALIGAGVVPPGSGAFGPMLLLPGFALLWLRRRRMR